LTLPVTKYIGLLAFTLLIGRERLSRHFDTEIVGKAGTREIDFIAIRANEKLYIQVAAYLLASEKTIEQELAPLLAIRDNYPKYVPIPVTPIFFHLDS
jgi:predicted AAA+ superfamily ATPase